MKKRGDLLCVDDERINLFVFQKIFGKKYNVITATSGEEAIEKLSQNPSIKWVISDMKMPGISGLDFIRKAKNEHQSACYFLFSGYAITEEVQQAIDSRLICGYFEKPANFDHIERVLQKH
jgi:DNA-binding NtrC family response regulator